MEWWAYSPHEEQGVQLVRLIVDRLQRCGLTHPRSPVPPEGPHFVYEAGPSLFLGRSGWGPLRVAWDTNLLIDYFNCGRILWEGGQAPETSAAGHGDELEALQLIMGLWILRDIRFHILPGVVSDSKRKPLAPERREQRMRAWHEFTRALTLIGEGFEEWPTDAPLPVRAVREALATTPRGNDRQLLEAALNRGLHVFMTCDKDVLRARPYLAAFGLLVASPGDLFQELTAAGAFECMFYPEQISWPFPDLQRATHLMAALPPNA